MVKQAVIIAGGKGKRLKDITGNKPKILVDIDGKTLLDFQINYLKSQKISKVHFCLGIGSKEIIDSLQSVDLDYTYSIEEQPLGTYGALQNAYNFLEDEFFVIYGDILTNFDIQFEFNKFEQLDSDIHLIVRYTNHPQDSDIVKISNLNSVENIDSSENFEFPYIPIGNSALFFAKKKSIKSENILIPSDIFKDFVKTNLNKLNITCSFSIDYIRDVGTLERYHKEVPNYKNKAKRPYKIALIDRDGTLIKDQGNENDLKKLKFNSEILKVVSYLQKNYFKIFLVSNQPGIAKGFFDNSKVYKFHSLIQHKLIEKNLNPLDGIYICPHHPEKGHPGENKELKINCNCRKPKSGLFDQIKIDHNLKNSEYIVIGDSLADYGFAKSIKSEFFLFESELTEVHEFDKIGISKFNKADDLVMEINQLDIMKN